METLNDFEKLESKVVISRGELVDKFEDPAPETVEDKYLRFELFPSINYSGPESLKDKLSFFKSNKEGGSWFGKWH